MYKFIYKTSGSTQEKETILRPPMALLLHHAHFYMQTLVRGDFQSFRSLFVYRPANLHTLSFTSRKRIFIQHKLISLGLTQNDKYLGTYDY